ncbi:MAG: hypothetical protein ACUVQI_05070 [Thermochromatium sp.]
MTIDPTVASRFVRLRWMIYVILVPAYMTAFFHRIVWGGASRSSSGQARCRNITLLA